MNTESLKKEPTSLAVSDLQLLVAFYMRKGLDLTRFMETQNNAEGREELVIQYVTDQPNGILDPYVKLYAKFDRDGSNIFIKYINLLNDGEGNL